MILYLVKDGINGVGCLTKNGEQLFGTNFYLITYDFKSNEGYIEEKGSFNWRLYTQVGQQIGKSKYYHFSEFNKCVETLKILSENKEIKILTSNDLKVNPNS